MYLQGSEDTKEEEEEETYKKKKHTDMQYRVQVVNNLEQINGFLITWREKLPRRVIKDKTALGLQKETGELTKGLSIFYLQSKMLSG